MGITSVPKMTAAARTALRAKGARLKAAANQLSPQAAAMQRNMNATQKLIRAGKPTGLTTGLVGKTSK